MARNRSKPGTAHFVLDCSVTLAWFFDDETSAYAEAVQQSLTELTAVVPPIWPLEVANALVVGERRKRTTEAKSTKFIELLGTMPIRVNEETAVAVWTDRIRLARSYGLSVYDAAYLELAVRRSIPLASLDKRLKATAAKLGVQEFRP